MQAIRCSQLVKTYPGKPPVEAVRGIDLEVQSGECFGVLGPNGAGKTTTIEVLEGLLPPTSGDVEVLACGESGPLDTLRDWLRQGPPMAKVESVEETRVDYRTLQGFTIG